MTTLASEVVRARPFGRTGDGAAVTCYELRGEDGFAVEVLDYGAIIRAIRVPDADGRLADVVLGYDDIVGYERDSLYLGAVVGRYAGRIGGANFTLDGERHELAANNGANHLHGGATGFNKRRWTATQLERGGLAGVSLAYRSPDGEEGYPGTLHVQVIYTISAPGVLAVDYVASTDRATPLNLTQHSYFNLAGEGSGDVLAHRAMIDAGSYLPVRGDLIPAGDVASVEGTPFDFRQAHAIGERIDDPDEQLRRGGGYDHTYVLRHELSELARAARITEPASGRVLEVWTTEPGMQLYTANFLEVLRGKHGHPYARRTAVCLETQHFPDSPNEPRFPSTVLRPGEVMRSRTEFRFSVQR